MQAHHTLHSRRDLRSRRGDPFLEQSVFLGSAMPRWRVRGHPAHPHVEQSLRNLAAVRCKEAVSVHV